VSAAAPPRGDFYVTLTGSKNNAGDFLIKHRAHALLRWQRPDRELVDFDGWKPLDAAQLETVNRARALILCGGPALQRRMVPKVYALADLDAVRAPIVSLGIGWMAANGRWADTLDFPLTEPSLALLRRMDRDGLASSVRDYHTLAVLQRLGLNRFVNTGCPALYERAHLEPGAVPPGPMAAPRTIGFSLGIAQRESRQMREQARALVLGLRERYPDAALTVAFHHALATQPADARFAEWLDGHGIARADVSGGHDGLIRFYQDCDLHVGYRVHAHIYRISLGKPSVLVSEDGRGRAQELMLGGTVLRGYEQIDERKWRRSLGRRLGNALDPYVAAPALADEALALLGDPVRFAVARAGARQSVLGHFERMRAFLRQLP
jgi:hypothetical protein